MDCKGVENLPVLISKDFKHRSKVDATKIYKVLGLNGSWARKNKQILGFWEEINVQLKVIYPDIKIGVDEALLSVSEGNLKVHEKQYEDYFGVLMLIHHQGSILADLFVDPWVVSIVDSVKDRVAAAEFTSNAPGRTKNIPVPVFLKTMDAAARYVLDYADPLFDAEKTLKSKYSELERKQPDE